MVRPSQEPAGGAVLIAEDSEEMIAARMAASIASSFAPRAGGGFCICVGAGKAPAASVRVGWDAVAVDVDESSDEEEASEFVDFKEADGGEKWFDRAV